MSLINTQSEKCFVQLETTYGIAPNSSGTASVAGTDACLITKLALNAKQPTIKRPDKTQSLSAIKGRPGRRVGEWSALMALAPSGTAGVVPDWDAFMQAAMGKAPVIVADTSVSYGLEDAQPSLTVYSFRDPSTALQRVATGCIVNQLRIFGQNEVAMLEFSGENKWTMDSSEFSGADSTARSGLTAFPSLPSSPVTGGDMVTLLDGVLTIDGNVYLTLTDIEIIMLFNRQLRKDVLFTGRYPGKPSQSQRDIKVRLSIYEEDTTAMKTLVGKIKNGQSVDASIQFGTVAGGIVTVPLNDLLFDVPQFDDSKDAYELKLEGSANATTATSKDEAAFSIT